MGEFLISDLYIIRGVRNIKMSIGLGDSFPMEGG
jgi:hypothetical protein